MWPLVSRRNQRWCCTNSAPLPRRAAGNENEFYFAVVLPVLRVLRTRFRSARHRWDEYGESCSVCDFFFFFDCSSKLKAPINNMLSNRRWNVAEAGSCKFRYCWRNWTYVYIESCENLRRQGIFTRGVHALSRKESFVAEQLDPVRWSNPEPPQDRDRRELQTELTGGLTIIHVFVLALPAARPPVSSIGMVTAMARRWSWVQILNQDDSFPNGEPFYPTNPQGAFRYDSVQHALRRDWTRPSCISSMIMLRAAEVGLTRPLQCRQHSASDKKRSEVRRGCAFEPVLHCLLLSLRSSNIQITTFSSHTSRLLLSFVNQEPPYARWYTLPWWTWSLNNDCTRKPMSRLKKSLWAKSPSSNGGWRRESDSTIKLSHEVVKGTAHTNDRLQ